LSAVKERLVLAELGRPRVAAIRSWAWKGRQRHPRIRYCPPDSATSEANWPARGEARPMRWGRTVRPCALWGAAFNDW